MAPPVLVIGMSRSGTTFVARALATRPEVHLEIEPHVVWKAGSFQHLDDECCELDPLAVRWIRSTLLRAAAGRVLVEKSPVNSLRPALVHAAFPDARVIAIDRDPLDVIASNVAYSLRRHALSPSIVIRKYLVPTAAVEPSDVRFDEALHATGGRPLAAQLRRRDLVAFAVHTARLLRLRRAGLVPFGPRIAHFASIVASDGLVGYHVAQHRAGERHRREFATRYGDALRTFRLESLVAEPETLRELFAWAGLVATPSEVDGILAQVRARRDLRSDASDDDPTHVPGAERRDAIRAEIETRLASG